MKKGELLNNEKIGDAQEILKIKAKTFCKENVQVHISFNMLSNKGWNNGIIIEVKEDYFVLDEKQDGLKDIFFKEIRNIERFTSIEERGEK